MKAQKLLVFASRPDMPSIISYKWTVLEAIPKKGQVPQNDSSFYRCYMSRKCETVSKNLTFLLP